MGKKQFFETAEFKKLNEKWNKKLKDAEFDDIFEDDDTDVIRPQIIGTQKVQYHGGEDYYELCQKILREFRFKKEIHRLIFELHANGLSERRISEELDRRSLIKMSQKGINGVIRRIKEQFLKGE